jgi:hypothetical protein
MKTNATLACFLGTSLLLATGCKEDLEDQPEPLPESSATYSRSIVYDDNEQHRDTTFQAQHLKMYASQNAESLTIGVHPATSTEGISFTLDRDKLPAALTGTYTLKTLRDGTLDANVAYYYDLPASLGGGTILYASNVQHITGSLTITGYDAKRQLLDGTYTTTLEDSSDPTVKYSTFPKWECNITISGTFTNVPLKTVE